MPRAWVVAAALLAVGCSSVRNGDAESVGETASQQEGVRITMERLPCFGTCPHYSVTLAGDGTVTWNGVRFVQTVGAATARVEPSVVSRLVETLTDGGWFEFEERYVMDAPACGPYHTDAPRVKATLAANGRSRSIEHDFGCGGAPEKLRELYDAIDRAAGTQRWIGTR